jgi:hypothetical protein
MYRSKAFHSLSASFFFLFNTTLRFQLVPSSLSPFLYYLFYIFNLSCFVFIGLPLIAFPFFFFTSSHFVFVAHAFLYIIPGRFPFFHVGDYEAPMAMAGSGLFLAFPLN